MVLLAHICNLSIQEAWVKYWEPVSSTTTYIIYQVGTWRACQLPQSVNETIKSNSPAEREVRRKPSSPLRHKTRVCGDPRRPLTSAPSCSFTQERCHSSRAIGENQISQSRLRFTQLVESLPPWHPKLENRKNKGSGGSGNLLWIQICPCPTC